MRVNKCQLSVQFSAKRAKFIFTVYVPTGLSIVCIAPLSVGRVNKIRGDGGHYKSCEELVG